MPAVITNNIDLWSSALLTKSTAGRGSNGRVEAYGIKKLRELILELAVRGKLMPQDSNDVPASMLLREIAKERNRLAKEGKIKKPKELPEISMEERPFDLPMGWEYVRLNELGEWGAGATPSRGRHDYYGGEIPWFKSGELVYDYISESEERVTELALKEASLRYNKPGDVLIAMYGATIGKTSILNVAATTNQAVCACTPFNGFANIFLLTLLKAYKSRFVDQGAGGAQPNISREKIIATVIALPPTAEQHRIVDKVDELMALCDQLEQQQTNNIEAHQVLVEALLGTLTNVESQEEFTEAWTRIANHIDTLFTTEQSIDQLKQTILQLAVMGKLVRQDPSDEPACVLLDKIAEEKALLIKKVLLKKEKLLPEISIEEIPYELPAGWVWSRFGTVWNDSFYGPRFGSDEYVAQGGYPTIRTTDMTADGKISLKNPPEVLVDKSKLSLYGLEKGDLIITRSGSIGTMAIYDLDIIAIPSAYLIRVRLPKAMSSEYTLLMLMSPLGQSYLGLNTTSVGVPNVNATKMSLFVFAIPPLAEQHRIVAKINELMTLCDTLKARLSAAQTTQIHITDTIVEQAVA